MIDIKPLANWEAFENEVDSFFENVKKKRSQTQLPVSTPIFRGLSAQSWCLATTLERYSSKEYPVEEYYKIMRGIKPALESFMEKRWDLAEEFTPIDNPYMPPEGYPFMIYLRHHGFPSPLLDWTTSPYVAAFFAFESPALPKKKMSPSIRTSNTGAMGNQVPLTWSLPLDLTSQQIGDIISSNAAIHSQ